MRSGSHAALSVVLCLAVLAGPGLATQAPPSDGLQGATGTTISIHLHTDGDARFVVSTSIPLNGSNETRAFRALAEDFEGGSGGVGYDMASFERAVARASVATGRPMNATDVGYEATIRNETDGAGRTGRLELSFEWTNFSAVNGETLRVGDAFETPNGTWLPGLTADQRLVVELPPGYTLQAAQAPVEDGALVWRGPADFEEGDLGVVLERGQPPTQGTPTPNGSAPGGEDPRQGLSMPSFGGVALVVGVGALVAYALASREGDLPPSTPGEDDGNGGEGRGPTGGATESEPGPDSDPESDPGSAATTESDRSGGAVTPPPDDGVEEELLSDEERVERLLRSNGGRMRQADIVTETGWSNAKVSQLLSSMDEADRVDKLRIGRENLISLPGVETGLGDRE